LKNALRFHNIFVVTDAVNYCSITFDFWIQRIFLRNLEQILRLIQVEMKTKRQLNYLIPGRLASSIKKLMSISAFDTRAFNDLFGYLPSCFTYVCDVNVEC